MIFKGGGQKDGRDPVFSGGAGQPGEEVQETGGNLRWKWKGHGKAWRGSTIVQETGENLRFENCIDGNSMEKPGEEVQETGKNLGNGNCWR